MRIAEVCVRFGAPGGAETHVARIARELAQRGHEVVVVTSDLYTEVPWKRGGPFEAPPPGVEVVRVPIRKRDRPPFGLVYEGLDGALEQVDADVYHAHSHRYPHLPVTAKVARRLKRPWCITPHFHPMEDHDPWWKHALGRVGDLMDAARVYHGASRVFTVTDLERTYLAHMVQPRRMVTVPNGLDLAAWSDSDGGVAYRAASGHEAARDYVLYAGRLASNKGLATLLDAWAEVAPRHPALDLVIAGPDWGEGPALQAKAKQLGLHEAGRVRFAGKLPDAAYRSAMHGCRAFVLPSEWEAFGIVLLEAMACGKPCVATSVGGVPEVVRHGQEGMLVPSGDAAELAEALDAMLSDAAQAARMGDAGRARAQGFDWSAVGARLEAELLAVVEGARGRA